MRSRSQGLVFTTCAIDDGPTGSASSSGGRRRKWRRPGRRARRRKRRRRGRRRKWRKHKNRRWSRSRWRAPATNRCREEAPEERAGTSGKTTAEPTCERGQAHPFDTPLDELYLMNPDDPLAQPRTSPLSDMLPYEDMEQHTDKMESEQCEPECAESGRKLNNDQTRYIAKPNRIPLSKRHCPYWSDPTELSQLRARNHILKASNHAVVLQPTKTDKDNLIHLHLRHDYTDLHIMCGKNVQKTAARAHLWPCWFALGLPHTRPITRTCTTRCPLLIFPPSWGAVAVALIDHQNNRARHRWFLRGNHKKMELHRTGTRGIFPFKSGNLLRVVYTTWSLRAGAVCSVSCIRRGHSVLVQSASARSRRIQYLPEPRWQPRWRAL